MEVPKVTPGTLLDPERYDYDKLDSGEPYDWGQAARGDAPWDNQDFHVDLGCGRIKKGRFGIDRFYDPGVNLVQDLDKHPVLPFADGSIKSIISHHFMEHIGEGFVPLMDECHRVLASGGLLRIIVPLFPSHAAVADPDHRRYFMEKSFEMFCGTPEGHHWAESFSTPYTNCRFRMMDEDITGRNPDPHVWWTPEDAREMRVALVKW